MAIYKKVSGDIVKVAGYGDIADNLTTLSPVMSLSAKQGNVLDTNKAERTDISSIITTGTKNTTGAQITSGTYFYLNGELVKAKSNIAINADYTLNTNYELATVGGVLTELNSKRIGSYINSNPLTLELPSISCIVSFSSNNYRTAMYLVTSYSYTYGVVTKIVDDTSALSISLSSDNKSITITNNTQRAGWVYILSLK